MNRKVIISVLIVIFIIIIGLFIWAFNKDNSKNEVNTSKENYKAKEDSKPKKALTLEKDKIEQEELAKEDERKAEEEQRKKEEAQKQKKNKKKEEIKKKQTQEDKSKQKKQIKVDLTKASEYILVTMHKSSEFQNKSSTQAKLSDIATSNFIENYIGNHDEKADEKIVDIKNLTLYIDDEDKLLTKNAEGHIVYDEIVKPKNKNNEDIKPSVQTDAKMKLWFKEEDGKLKFDKLRV